VAIKRDLGGAGTQKGDLDQFINNLADSIQTNQIASKADELAVKRSPIAKKIAGVQGAVAKGLLTGEPTEEELSTGLGKLQFATASISPTDEIIVGLERIAKPYRQEVAPRISAALLASSETYRTANSDIAGNVFRDFASISPLVPNSALFNKAIEDSRKAIDPDATTEDYLAARVYSPGRSLVLGIADIVPGEQGAEKLDWENGKEVDEFYRQGLPQFFSGFSDIGFNGLDPAFVGLGLTSTARKLLLKRPISAKNSIQLGKEVEAAKARGLINSASPILDMVEEVSSPETFNPGALDYLGIFGNSASSEAVTRVMVNAQIVGGRDLAADTLKVAMDPGNTGAIEILREKSKTISAQIDHLIQKEQKINEYTYDLLDPETFTPALGTVKELRKYAIDAPPIGDDLIEGQKKLAAYLQDDVASKIRSEIRAKSALADVYLQSKDIAGFISNESFPISILKKFEETRVLSAGTADDTYWGFLPRYSPTGGISRVGYWVNPSTRSFEAPRGMAQLSGPAGFRSAGEFDARVRDLAKKTGMSPEEKRALSSDYRMLGTKSEMFGAFDELLIKTQMDITTKHVPRLAQLNPDQQKLFRSIWEAFNVQTNKTRGEVISGATKKNYTITVGRDQTVKLPQLEQLIDSIASDYASEISKGARTVPTKDEIRYVTEELIKGTPTTTSQVPGIHFAPRVSEVEDFVVIHKEELEHIIDDILDGTLNPDIVREITSSGLEDYVNKGRLAGVDVTGSGVKAGGKVVVDNLGKLYLGYQNNFWKPMTLLGFGYTSRNLFEGLSRVAILFAEYHEERGYKYSDMFTDFAGSNTRLANRRTNKAEAKAWRDNINEFNSKFKTLTEKMSSKQVEAEETFLNAQDSIAMSMKDFEEIRLGLDDFVSSNADSALFTKTIKRSAELTFKQNIPKDASKEFIQATVAGDYKRAWELSTSMSPAQLTSNLIYIQDEALGTLREISRFVDKGTLSPAALGMARRLQISLSHIQQSTHVSYLALFERAKVRGQIDEYMENIKLKQPKKVRSGEGEFEPIPGSGYLLPDSYADNIGQIMRGQVSSSASTSSTVLNLRQQIAEQKWNMETKEELIFPNVMINENPTGKINPSWVEAFSDYMNNIYYNDALAVKILSAKTPQQQEKLQGELESWLLSRDSIQWRKELEYEVSKYPTRSDGKSKYVSILLERIEEVNRVLPLRGMNGDDLSGLRQKVIDRTFTNADAVSIPPIDRSPVNGVTLSTVTKGKAGNAMRRYRATVNSIFKYLGTVPEDNFVRFPFYRTVYRNEVRRRVRVISDAGKDPANYEEQILKIARQEAYKATMERLYSIERYTDLAQALQFVSPFYMAGQNSARFYLGAVGRKPETMVNALKIWNIPNSMGIVYDEEGNRIAYDTPWNAEDNTIAVGLPASVARLYGAEEFATPKGSLDVFFQGRVPGIPSLGGGFVDTATVNFMRYVSGTSYDPDRWAMRMGYGPNFIGEKVVPFYQSVKENPNENVIMRTARALIGYGSQWKPLMAVGSALPKDKGKANLTFMTRHDSIYRSELIKLEREGGQYTAEEHVAAMDRAFGKTVITLLAESLLGNFALIVKPKFRNAQQKERDIVNSYIKKYGYEQGIIEYGKQYVGEGSAVNAAILASANVATDNIFGLFSNSETIYNFNRNKDLVSEIDDLNSNSSVVGYFMNTGNPSEDFSVTAEEYLYTTTINNKNIKSKQYDTSMIQYELQRRGYNNEYYPYATGVDLMQKADAQGNREESSEFYQELKDIRKAELEKKYPIYANEKDFKKQESIVNDIRTMYAFTQNEKFMNTVGYNSKNVMAAYTYLYEVRPYLVADKKNKTKSTKEIDTVKLQFLSDISVGDPELEKFLQIFFSRDDYTEIDPTNIWEKK
jgi:hypothetical protein